MPPKIPTGSGRIPVANLTPDAFRDYGVVIQNPATHAGQPDDLTKVEANQGSATKWLDITHLDNHYNAAASGQAAKPVLNMFVCKPRKLRAGRLYDVKILERHPFTPQTFVPMGLDGDEKDTCYLVIVAPTLAVRSRTNAGGAEPPYPTPPVPRKRSLRERLLGARPNPFTNDHSPATTPPQLQSLPAGRARKGVGPPDLDNLRAFIARGDQAVTYGPGTWHAPMVVLGDAAVDFVVVQFANGVGLEDCQEIEIGVSDGGDGLAVDIGSSAAPVAKL